MSDQPNIVFFYWDNFAWGELGCYGGGVLRGAPTPRIDGLADEGLKLLNFNVEAQCTPSRSALLTGRHAIRSGTQAVPIAGGPDGLTRWEVTIAQALSDAGYATGMWGKWHLGSDPEGRSPVDFGFDEAVWCPRTADEVLWTMQSYFPNGDVTAEPYAGPTKIPLVPEPIFARKKGEKHEVLATYDAEFRAGFDRKITEWVTDFMTRSKAAGKPFYVYLPYTQVHIPPIPDPEYAGKTKRGNWGDILTQMDDFTGVVLDKLDELGIADDTIVVWASDNGADTTYRFPAVDPDPVGGQWHGFSGPWRGGLFTALEGSNRTPCIVRWPGKVPAGKVSNELVHTVDWYTTLLNVAGAKIPGDRIIDGMDMRDFLLGDAEESGRDIILHLQGNRLQAAKWHQWKAHLFKQDDFYSTWTPLNMPLVHNLEWDPREEHQVDFPHGWVAHPIAAAAAAFLKSLAVEPPIKTGTPDPYTPPKPGELRPETHLQIGPIIQFVTTLVQTHDELPDPSHGIEHPTGWTEAQHPTRLCVLLVCFAGAKRASDVRSELVKGVRSIGGDALDEAVLKVSHKGKALVYDPRRTIAGALTPALTWGVFGLVASGGSWKSLVIWAVIGALCGGVWAYYTEHLASKSQLKRIGERMGSDTSALAIWAVAADAEQLLSATAPLQPATASVAAIADDLSAKVFAGAATPLESSSTGTGESRPPETTSFLSMLLLRYPGEHAARAALQAARKADGGPPEVELVFESAKSGKRRVISPAQGVAVMAETDIVGWGAFGVVWGAIVGAAGHGGVLSSIDSGVVTGVLWAIFGLFAGALYGLWAGRGVSARRLKGVGPLLPPDSSAILAWADGAATERTIGALSTPDAQTLGLRFNPIDRGAILEV